LRQIRPSRGCAPICKRKRGWGQQLHRRTARRISALGAVCLLRDRAVAVIETEGPGAGKRKSRPAGRDSDRSGYQVHRATRTTTEDQINSRTSNGRAGISVSHRPPRGAT
ncbi:unnamed protein product, partial [Ectocarpus sp. 12 AP-2014]